MDLALDHHFWHLQISSTTKKNDQFENLKVFNIIMYVNYNNKLILFLVSPLLTARGSSQYFSETIVNKKSES